jgi:hypothetical protein
VPALYPGDLSDIAINIWLLLFLVMLLLFMLIYGYGYVTPPTQRRRWLRKNYPGVARAVERYRRPGDKLETYYPALILSERRYFLLAYHDKGQPERVRRFLLVDETGQVIDDLELAKVAVGAKSLALHTIHYGYHQERLGNFHSTESVERDLSRFFDLLRRQRNRFEALGQGYLEDYSRVLEAEEAALALPDATKATIELKAEWAAEHGLSRLTEVSYEEVVELENRIREARKEAVAFFPILKDVAAPARRLAQAVGERRVWPAKETMIEGFMAMTDLAAGVQGAEGYQIAQMSEEDIRAWKEGTAWAAEVEGGSVEEKWATAE